MSDTPETTPAVVAPEVIKTSKIWMKDSSGHPSISVTMLAVSFWVTTLAYIASIFVRIGPVEFKSFDAGACGAYFGLILGTYVARRATEAKWGNPNVPPYQPAPYAPYVPYQPSPINRPYVGGPSITEQG